MKVTVKTYAKLQQWADAYAQGKLGLLGLIGGPGLGKSRIIKDRVQEKARIIEGRATAFQLYCDLYNHLDELFVIDDVDELYCDRDAVRLLKCLCQTEEVKSLAWHSATSKLDQEGIPREFTTRSKVAIIANVWKDLNANIDAVNDRGILVRFEPTAQEVHKWAAGWYRGQKVSAEVYKFIGHHLSLVAEPSGRHYVTAQQVKNADLDWQAALYETWGLSTEQMACVRLIDDKALTQAQRVRKFKNATGKSRATYYRLAQKLPRRIQKP